MSDTGIAALPRGWATAILPDLIGSEGFMSDGDWVETEDQDPNGDVRLTQLADVGDGVFRNRSNRYMTSQRARELNCTFLKLGDVMIARMPDPLGRACLFPGSEMHCVTVVDVCIVRPAKAISPKWLASFINAPSFRIAVADLQSGSTRKRISKANLSTIPLPVPPQAEQHKIVDALDSYLTRLDDAIATLERVQRNLKRYRASVLKAAVEGRLVPTEAELARVEGRDYEPASKLLERILVERRRRWEEAELAKMKASGKVPKDDKWKAKYEEPAAPDTSELPELPEGWCWANVAQLGHVSGGLTQNAKRNALALRYPFLRVANVYANELRLNDVEQIGVDESEVPRVLLQRGDLLVVEGNGSADQIGRVALWDGSIAPCLHQNHLIKVRLSPITLANWTMIWLLSPEGRTAIVRVASSTSGLHTLSISKVAALPVPLCPSLEQQRISDEIDRVLSVISESETLVDADLKRCHRLRQSILKWAFEGKLVDQDPNDEPASALLERIRAERAETDTARKQARPAKRS